MLTKCFKLFLVKKEHSFNIYLSQDKFVNLFLIKTLTKLFSQIHLAQCVHSIKKHFFLIINLVFVARPLTEQL
jgi:hypothetical protein